MKTQLHQFLLNQIADFFSHAKLAAFFAETKRAVFGIAAVFAFAFSGYCSAGEQHLLLVVGAGGETDYSSEFQSSADLWQQAAERQGWSVSRVGPTAAPANIAMDPLPISDGKFETKSDDAGSATEVASGEGSTADTDAIVEAENATAEITTADDTTASEADSGASSDFDTLKQSIERFAGEAGEPVERLWIVMIGHGTFARNVAKFNLRGPDISPQQLKPWLAKVDCPIVFVGCFSASSPFLTELAGKSRIILTATRSGTELNFSHFGKYLAQAINDESADIDHDHEVSLLEAFLAAVSQTERFYREDARLVTEHALIDDNGDRLGTSADFFQGVHTVKPASEGQSIDGEEAKRLTVFSSEASAMFTPELLAQRSMIEANIDALRKRKRNLAESDYFDQLEQLLLQLDEVYSTAEELAAASKSADLESVE